MSKLGRFGVAFGALALTLAFAAARFPWHELTPRVETLASEAAGVQIQLGRIGFGVGPLGVAAHGADVRIAWPAGEELLFERIHVRPALSFSWLTGEPSLRILTEGGPGDFDGVASGSGVTGSFDVEEGEALPWTLEPPITGSLVGLLDLAFANGEVAGSVEFEGREGSLLPPGLPVAIPFDRLTAVIELTTTGVSLAPVVVEGPLAAGRVTGTIVPPAGRWEVARLDLVVELDHFDEALGQMMRNYGLDLAAGTRLTIQGTAANPRIR